MDKIRKQLIAQAERLIELLEDDKTFYSDDLYYNGGRAEITAKMKEFRRDTIRLEKKLYPCRGIYR